jgi:hypothetical protein
MNQVKQVFPQGRVRVSLTAGQLLAVAAVTPAQVYLETGYPSFPTTLSLAGTVINGETVFTPAGGVAAVYVIEASAAGAQYAIGTAPRCMQQAAAQVQKAPGVLNATGTLTGAMILAGIVTSTTGAAVAATLDTGAAMDLVVPDMNADESFDWSVINTGGNAFTVTASAGHTLVGNMVVAAGSSARFRTRKTAAATYVTYSNPTPIS